MTRVTVETTHADASAARTVVASVTPDNTADVVTEADGAFVRTVVERPTTGTAASSTDDYVVNVTVADRVIGHVRGNTSDADAGTDDAVANEGADDAEQTTAERNTHDT